MSISEAQQATLNALLCEAVQNRNLEMAEKCVAKGADVHMLKEGRPLLHLIASTYLRDDLPQGSTSGINLLPADRAMMTFLLSEGVHIDVQDANNQNQTLLLRAVKCARSVELIKFLIENGADPFLTPPHDADGIANISPLEAARKLSSFKAERDEIIDTLLNAVPDNRKVSYQTTAVVDAMAGGVATTGHSKKSKLIPPAK